MKNFDRKLIYILNHYSHKSPSHFYHVLNLLNEIANNGVEIALIIEKCEDKPEITNSNITLYNQNQTNKFFRVIELYNIISKLQSQGFQNIFVRISWVAIFVAIIVSWFKKLNTYYWLSGQGSIELYKELKGIRKIRYYFKNVFKIDFIKTFVYKFVTGPETMAKYAINELQVKPNKVLMLYNDVDLKRFNKFEQTNIQIDNFENKKIIFFAHRFSPVRKSLYYIPYIIDEFYKHEHNKDFVFLIAGSGPEEKELKNLINHSPNKNNIFLLGNIPNQQIQAYYKKATIFINPTYAEGFPRVMIEAMASGLPVVTTNAGGITDIVGKLQAEYMVDKEDRDAFATKLIHLAQNQSEQEMLRNENLETVQKFSTENVAKMYINAIFE